jgi:hypothetical protein
MLQVEDDTIEAEIRNNQESIETKIDDTRLGPGPWKSNRNWRGR